MEINEMKYKGFGKMKKILSILIIMFACVHYNIYAVGTLSVVYLNPVTGVDANDGSLTFPVKTWDKALSLADHGATIYITWSFVAITSNMTIDGNQYGATNITVAPHIGYTGALFAIADNATGVFSNITISGDGSAQSLLSVNNGGTLTIGSDVSITNGGEIALDGGAHPINLTATPPVGMNYPLLTSYSIATDEGRAIINTGSVTSPLQYFTLVTPQSNADVAYELGLDGTTIRLHELPIDGIYLDPLNGVDVYSGAKSNRPIKTLARAVALWNSRNTASPGIVTDIYLLTPITLTGNLTLDSGIKLTRFTGDADHAATMMEYMIVYSGYELTVDSATVHNSAADGYTLYSSNNGKLTLNKNANIISNNTNSVIHSYNNGTVIMNPGSTITSTTTNANASYCIYTYTNADVTINGGTITAGGSGIYKYSGTLVMNGGTINHTGASHCIYQYHGSVIIYDCDITTRGTDAFYNHAGTIRIDGGNIRNERTSTGRNIYNKFTGTITVNGGVVDGGLTTAIYCDDEGALTSNGGALNLNGGTISSTNTVNGTVYVSPMTTVKLNGVDAIVNGILNITTTNIETHPVTITSPSVANSYTIRVADGVIYAALVKSNPVIDLFPYRNLFTLEPKPGYALGAYANKGEAIHSLVLYDPDGIYVNDYTGNDANPGTSPGLPVKTLANAAGKTTSTQTSIYICDSTLTINTPQTLSPLAPKDTIRSFMFRKSANLMRVATGGALTLQHTAIFAPSINVSSLISINDGSLQLDTGAVLFNYINFSDDSPEKYGIQQTGGTVFMSSGSKIASYPVTPTAFSRGFGIRKTGGTLTVADGVIIERQSYYAISNAAGSMTIGEAVIQHNSSGLYGSQGALTITGGTASLNGTIIQNSTYRALQLSGNSTVVNMTDGLIANNGNSLSTTAISIENQAVFNFSGGTIENNIASATSYGEQVTIASGGKMNFTGGVINATGATKNTIYVYAADTTAAKASRLILSDQAVFDSGYIYCSSAKYSPVILSTPLSPAKNFNINLGDNMAGCMLVDGTSTGIPASVANFTLNPQLTGLSLQQSGNDVIVGSTAIYLNGGTGGNDANNGSTAVLAVKTFKRARALLQQSGGDLIIIIGAPANLGNAGEIDAWDLDFKSDAVVQRGLGYTGFLVTVPSGKNLTLSDITFDGNKDNVNIPVEAIIHSVGKLTINAGTIIKNNNNVNTDASHYAAVYSTNGNCYMNGGEIIDNSNHGIYCSATGTSEFIMTGGRISGNANYGIFANSIRRMRLLGGEISQNGPYGVCIFPQSGGTGIFEVGGTARIIGHNEAGIRYSTSNYILDSLIISGGEISNNAGFGISLYANHVSVTGGTISHTTTGSGYGYGLHASANKDIAGTSFKMTGGTIQNNALYGAYLSNYEHVSMSGGTISGNGNNVTSFGLSLNGVANRTGSVVSLTGGTITGNGAGLSLSTYENMSISNVNISGNIGEGIRTANTTAGFPNTFTMTGGNVSFNGGYGINFAGFVTYSVSGNVQITNNKNSGIYSNTTLTSSIAGDVLIKGNRSNTFGGGIHINQGAVNISDNVTFEADTATNGGGGIYVAANGIADISGNIQVKDCRNTTTLSTLLTYGGSAINSQGRLSMTGGSITGCETAATPYGRGTVYVSGTNSLVVLTNVTIRDNLAYHGGAIYVNTNGKITLYSDTIINNTTTGLTNYTSPSTGAIHIAGGATGLFSLRDKCYVDGDFFFANPTEKIFVDEALLSSGVGAFHLLPASTTVGTVVVSPNGTTVTDASQFLTHFTLMNQNIARGLDKGGTDDKHIIIVNQFFIDGTQPAGGNGASPPSAYNDLSQITSALNTAYTTVWVSGPVKTTETSRTLSATQKNVNIRRYTGFEVAAQAFPPYDSVMITVEPGHTLIINGGSSDVNTLTISGEGGSGLTDASIFKNNGTLTLDGYTNLYFNPIAGNGGAIYQNGILNLSGNVDFNVYSPSAIYLAENKVVNITGALNTTTPIGITVETAPANTHIPGRVVVTGSTTNVTPVMTNLFYNEIPTDPLPIGYTDNGTTANLMFYLADRNVSVVPPLYTTLQDAFDAAVPSNNDEVRLYGHTQESVIVDKRLRYNSQGHAVRGSFTLDSLAQIQLLHNLLADTLYIRATTFSNKAQLDLNNKTAHIADAAYLDLRLPPNPATGDWYPVNLPFDAKVSDIRDASDTTRQILHLQDFGIAAYDAQRRATYGIGNQPSNPNNDWQYLTVPTMTNGNGYMVTAGGGLQTLRFKAANLNLFSTVTAPLTYAVGPAGSTHHGLNYVSQPLPINAMIGDGIPSGSIVQVSEGLSSDRIGDNSYMAMTVNSSLVIAPYTNYFYQTNSNNTVTYTPTTNTATVRSGGMISSDVPVYYELRFYADDPQRYDALFVAASEYASKDHYEIGRDVVKMGSVGQAAQIWSVDFDVALCANEVVLEDGCADIPISVHTPVAGKEYHIKLQNTVKDREQLWLCRAGRLLQNLTETPEYTLTGTGDTTTEYSLRILSGVTSNRTPGTGTVYVYAENKAITIYGLQPEDEYVVFDLSGRIYASGKAISNRTKINAGTGAYMVQANGKTYKVIVP